MIRITITPIATASRAWMRPSNVWELTTPNAHRIREDTNSGHSMANLRR
jgi:hypothetical protein